MMKSYDELSKLKTFKERFDYLKLEGSVGSVTFGADRIYNQKFYSSKEWRRIRRLVILRDKGFDLGLYNPDYEIQGAIIIHHINPISIKDFNSKSDLLMDMNNLISTSVNTHKAIHYSDYSLIEYSSPIIREKWDTCPWRNKI